MATRRPLVAVSGTLRELPAGDALTGLGPTDAPTFADLKIADVAGSERLLVFLTDLLARWALGAQGTAESGSNAGSDFFILRYNDAGTYIDVPFSITRATGQVDIANILQEGVFSSTGASRGVLIGNATQLLKMSVASTAGQNFMAFFNPNGQIGAIHATGSATTYATTSDYRRKDDIRDLDGEEAGAMIDALRPRRFVMDGQEMIGFIAHEFADVAPQSVIGEKDAVDEEGAPAYQSMQAGSNETIALLVAELQAVRQRLAKLEADQAA